MNSRLSQVINFNVLVTPMINSKDDPCYNMLQSLHDNPSMMVNTWWSFQIQITWAEHVSKWCCPTWNITTSQRATRFSNSVRFKRQSNWAFRRWYFKFLKFAWFVKLPHASFTHINQTRLEDYWGKNGHFATDKLLVSFRQWQVLAWSSKGTQGWLVWIKIFEETTRMMLNTTTQLLVLIHLE